MVCSPAFRPARNFQRPRAINRSAGNSRAKGIARLEALLAGRNLTEADARRAIGIADPPPATDAPAPEPVAETLTVEPDANGGDDRPDTGPDTGEDAGPIPLETASADVATILAGDAVQKACRDGLADYLMHTAGLDAETADRAARRAVDALKLPAPATPRTPRTGTKQDRLGRTGWSTCCAGPRALPWRRWSRQPPGNPTPAAEPWPAP